VRDKTIEAIIIWVYIIASVRRKREVNDDNLEADAAKGNSNRFRRFGERTKCTQSYYDIIVPIHTTIITGGRLYRYLRCSKIVAKIAIDISFPMFIYKLVHNVLQYIMYTMHRVETSTAACVLLGQ